MNVDGPARRKRSEDKHGRNQSTWRHEPLEKNHNEWRKENDDCETSTAGKETRRVEEEIDDRTTTDYGPTVERRARPFF